MTERERQYAREDKADERKATIVAVIMAVILSIIIGIKLNLFMS